MFVTPAYAQSAAPGADPFTGILLPMLLVFGIFYMLVWRPQQKKLKEHQAKITAVKRGDQVVTSGGIIGKVTGVGPDDSDEVTVEIAEGVKAKIRKSTLHDVLAKTEPAKTGSSKSDSNKKK